MMMSWRLLTQIAWMRAAMMANVGWPLPEPEHEEQQDAEDEIFDEIDVSDGMLRASTAGLKAVEKAMTAADCSRLQLAIIKHNLELVEATVRHGSSQYAGDVLEPRAAESLMVVDGLLRQQALSGREVWKFDCWLFNIGRSPDRESSILGL